MLVAPDGTEWTVGELANYAGAHAELATLRRQQTAPAQYLLDW